MSKRMLAGCLALSLALVACSGSHGPSRVAATRTATALASATPTAVSVATSTPTVTPAASPAREFAPAEIAADARCVSSRPAPIYHIALMNADGSDVRVLSGDLFYAHAPAWAPDSQRVVFAGALSGDGGLFVAELAGGEPRQLTSVSGSDDYPVWSPAGDWIAFTHRPVEGSATDLFIVRPDGSDRRQLTTAGDVQQIVGWLPDGRIAIVNATQGGWLAVDPANPAAQPTPVEPSVADPLESPDGRFTLFERGDDIFRMDVDGGHIRDLTDRPGFDTAPRWAPDSANIAFESTVGPNDAPYPARQGFPVPLVLRTGTAQQDGGGGPACVISDSASGTSMSGIDDSFSGVAFSVDPLSVTAGAPLTFAAWFGDPTGLTVVAYRYAVAASSGALQHDELLRPCAPPGGSEDACVAGTAHSLTPDLRLAPGHYLLVVSLTWQRGDERGFSEQGFNVEVQ